jgi:hypothetical protein
MKKHYPIVDVLKQKSDFFCPAKWTELFLYLNHGLSNSCHHPIPHNIPKELLHDPYVLHNTPHKLKMQQLMMEGQKPKECHMCWHMEDSDPTLVSDRFIKSEIWKDDIANLTPDNRYVPKFIEVVFDNYCNLKCSYCDGGQSSSWAAKIKQNPLELETDYRKLYSQVSISPGSVNQDYLDAWTQWWPEIKDQVKMLKISGGEPLLSKNFWKFMETLQLPADCSLSINSNFSVSPDLIDKFIACTGTFKTVTVGVSIDATDKISEYARQGLDFELLSNNITRYLSSTNNPKFKLYLQSTVNIFSVWGLIDKLNFHVKLKKLYPDQIVNLYSTIVRFPEFQSVLLLPQEITQQLGEQISVWALNNQDYLDKTDQAIVNKIATYLRTRPEPMNNLDPTLLKSDLKKFISYYNSSSKHCFEDIYPNAFLNWIKADT